MFSSNTENMLNAFFGGGVTEFSGREDARYSMKKLNRHQTVSVSLEDLYNGRTLQVKGTRRIICSSCGGSGSRKKYKQMIRCRGCGGTGTRSMVQNLGMMIQHVQVTCKDCSGTGSCLDPATLCQQCNGKKVVEVDGSIQVEIKPGMRDKECIAYHKMGDEFPGYATAGDLTIEILQNPHPYFERSQNDLRLKHEITLAEAICGLRFKVTQLDGRELLITRKRGEIIYPGEQKCVRGEGMPVSNTGKFGDLYIEFIVKYPEYVDENQIKLLKTALLESGESSVSEIANKEASNREIRFASRENLDRLKDVISRDEMSDDGEDEGVASCQTQ